jgi:hypothetical protein
VKVLSKLCFLQTNLEALMFEFESQLAQIKERCCQGCFSLKSVRLPSQVSFIHSSAFPKSCALVMVGNDREFNQWNEYRGKHGMTNFERGSLMKRSGVHFTVDRERFWVDVGGDVPFAEVNLILSRELNLYCDFEVWAARTKVNAQMTLDGLVVCSEFTIHRFPRPEFHSDWIGDLDGLEVVRELLAF